MQARPLTHEDCREFFAFFYPKLLSTGLVEPLAEFAGRSRGPIALALRSWHSAMTEGVPPDEALARMRPRFPKAAEGMLRAGFATSSLDFAVADINDIYASHESEGRRDEALASLAARYGERAGNICSGCVEREFEKLLRRAQSEGVAEVVLEQEGDRFIHAHFVAAKVVRVSEPSRAAVFEAMVKRLKAAARGKPLSAGKRKISVSGGQKQFTLADGAFKLRVRVR